MADSYDFSGIATAYDTLCGDRRIINKGAFDHQDGEIVPIVWRHDHKDITNFVGHASLSVNESPPGMRVKATLNKSKEGLKVKHLIQNGDISNLSIWANELIEHSEGSVRKVHKGRIREVSLVLVGQNPGARIDDVVMHSESPFDPDSLVIDGIIIHTVFPIEYGEETEEGEETSEVAQTITKPEPEPVVEHEGTTVADVVNSLSKEQKDLFNVVLYFAATGEKNPPAPAKGTASSGPTIKSVFDTLSEEQKKVLYFMAGEISPQSNLEQGDSSMPSHNIFEDDPNNQQESRHIAHEVVRNALNLAKVGRVSSLRDHFLAHSITDIDFLFPEAMNVETGGPAFYSREMGWVDVVLTGTKSRPFARIKSWYSDITADAARAKGYITGEQKLEEIIALAKRVTTPQTIYKLQKLERDDLVDITDFDVVVWLKHEMRLMLREELARAILIGDGRLISDDDKIQETNIRPIATDDDFYATKHLFHDSGNEEPLADLTVAQTLSLIDYFADGRQYYKGAGNPTLFTTTEALTKMLLVRDSTGRRIHETEASLASALRVNKIVEVPVMSGLVRVLDIGGTDYDVLMLGVIVNLSDYVVGADKGGETSFFDDFNLDFNRYTYLYETRVSGALVTPKSAVVVELVIGVNVP
jgi:HK97 family phage prohead protease